MAPMKTMVPMVMTSAGDDTATYDGADDGYSSVMFILPSDAESVSDGDQREH